MTHTRERLAQLSAEKRALLATRLQRTRGSGAGERHNVQDLVPDPARRHEPFPLTDLQQAYWVGRSSAFQLGHIAAHSYFELERDGWDLERLGRALRQLIDRHDMLRAVVLPDGQQQILSEVPPYQIQVVDLSAHDATSAAAALAALRSRMSHQVLPSDRWPLFEIRAARMANGRVRLFVSLDALIFDAWSIALFCKEWAALYAHPEASLEPLPVSFRDYVLAAAALERTEPQERSRQYWRDRLATLPPAPELPLAAHATSITDPHFVRRTRVLEPATWQRLKRRAMRASLTVSGVLLAAYAEVLSLWSQSRRFTINVPRFNRLPLHALMGDVLGEFASFTLLEADLTRDEGFAGRARRHQEQLLRDLDHGFVGGVWVVRELARAPDRASGAQFPVVFTAAPDDSRGSDDIGTLKDAVELLGTPVYNINQTPQVWLDNHVAEHRGALICDWDSVDALMPNGLSQTMLDAYLRLLQLLADDETSWQLSWPELAPRLLPSEQRQQRAAINGLTAPVPELLVHQMVAEQVPHRGDHPAVVSATRTLSHRELYQASLALGRKLRDLGARPNHLVAVVMEKGWEQIVAVYGVLQSGAAYLPIDSEVPRERLHYLLDHGQVSVVLTQSWLDASLDWPANVRRLCVDRDPPGAVDAPLLEPTQTVDDLAYVMFTSGSSGPPKGVMIAHRGLVNAIAQTNQHFEVTAADRVLALTALHHDMSCYDIFGILAAGGTLVLPEAASRRDPGHWLDLMRREGVTIWNSVPAMMEMLLEYAPASPERLPETLRLAFLGGDWISVSLPNRLSALGSGARVVSVGGPTETTLWNIWYPVDRFDASWKSIPYGRPIANARYYVLNDALVDCPTWVPGEMYCAGVPLAHGYWRDEENTRAKFFHHPRTGERLYRTGDIGRFLPDGDLEILGRADFQVKIQGQRIELGEIEWVIGQHPAVRAAVVSAREDGNGRQRLVAYVVPHPAAAATPDELHSFIAARLPEHMVPTGYLTLDRLPMTPNGKVDRKALPNPERPASPSPDLASRQSPLMRRLARLVADVLGLAEVDPQADLLGYGATSIDMVRIGNQLEKQLGSRPRIDRLFRLRTVAALAAYYEQNGQRPSAVQSPGDSDRDGGPAALIASYRVLLDPVEREAFKAGQPGLRRGDDDKPSILLEKPEVTDELRRQYARRRSHRRFALRPIPLAQFGGFLHCLRQIELTGKPTYRYASPGGLYPGQVYLHVKPGRVEGVPAGTYYYHPVDHRLVVLTPNADLDREIHIPFINTPIFDEAAFSIFLITQLSALAPAYGDRSIHFATLEAGIIAHLLETWSPTYGIGLCQIGTVDFDRVRSLFALEGSHVLIHSLLGGAIADADNRGEATGSGERQEADRTRRLVEEIKQLSSAEVRTLLEANRQGARGKPV